MALCFLILVCTCLITGYFLLKKSDSEVAHLIGICGTICLMIVLILAPWQILFLLLVLIYISISREYHTSKLNSIKTEEPQQSLNKLKADYNLIYRGIYYCTSSNTKSNEVKISQSTYQLSYRGSTYSILIDSNSPKSKLIPSSVTYKLRFRGSPYSINKTTPIKKRHSLEFESTTTNSLPLAH